MFAPAWNMSHAALEPWHTLINKWPLLFPKCWIISDDGSLCRLDLIMLSFSFGHMTDVWRLFFHSQHLLFPWCHMTHQVFHDLAGRGLDVSECDAAVPSISKCFVTQSHTLVKLDGAGRPSLSLSRLLLPNDLHVTWGQTGSISA